VGILDRAVLTVYTVALLPISLFAVLLALGWGKPFDAVRGALLTPNGRAAIGLLGTLLFVSSVRLLYLAFRGRGAGQQVVHETELGEVRISLDAVEHLVQRVSRQVKGVRDVRPHVRLAPDGVEADVRVWVAPDVSIPDLARELQEEVRRSVQAVVGVALSALEIRVENITTEARRGRVE
jgi:uncharacterized alkaline shock family protein YloU